MRNRRNSLLACAALAFALPCFAQEKLPSAESIIETYIEKIGGRAALEKLKSQINKGEMEVPGRDMKGAVTVYRAAPNKTRTVTEIAGIGKLEEGTDGETAWGLSAVQGARLKEGEEKTQALRAAEFNAELNWRKTYPKAEVAGVEDVDGKPCYKIVLTPETGTAVTRYYDKASGLMVRTSMTVKTPMGEIPMDSYVSDFRPEGGLLLPHKVTQKVMGREIVLTITSIQNNAEIDPAIFEIPAEVKALMKAK
ncbi:MAG: hypothetical protein ACE15B_16530 [Bryobacteraceae bacterium]